MRTLASVLVAGLSLLPPSAHAEERGTAAREAAHEPEVAPAPVDVEAPAEPDETGGDRPSSDVRRLRIVMLEIDFSEGLEEPLRHRLQSSLVNAMRRQHLEVVEPEAVAETLRPVGSSIAETCRAGRCVGWILEFLDGDAGLVAHIEAVESSYSVTLTLLGQYGDEIGRAERRCDICTFDELADSVAIAGGQLTTQIPRRVFVGRVGIFPDPESSAIAVDGVAIGRGALSLTLPVGVHVVEASLSGYVPARREVALEADDTLRLDLSLERGTRVEPVEERRVVWRPTLWSTTTVGLVTVLVGVILMGVHGSCRDAPTDLGCQHAFTAGVGLLAGGLGTAVASGVAIALFSTHAGE